MPSSPKDPLCSSGTPGPRRNGAVCAGILGARQTHGHLAGGGQMSGQGQTRADGAELTYGDHTLSPLFCKVGAVVPPPAGPAAEKGGPAGAEEELGTPGVLTMGAGFPPDTMQTSVKFWAW